MANLLSSITAYTPIPDPSQATTGLWDSRFQVQSDNVAQLNAALGAGSTLTLATGLFADGSALAPSVSFTSESSLGLYRSTSSTLAASYGTVDLTATKVVLTEPSAASHAATKNYVDVLRSGGVSSFQGSWLTAVSFTTISARSCVAFIAGSASNLSIADSTNSRLAPIAGVFMAVAAANTNSVVTYALSGEVGGFTGLSTASTYYLSTVGSVSATAPSAQSTIIYAVGVAKSSSTLVFRPQYLLSNAT